MKKISIISVTLLLLLSVFTVDAVKTQKTTIVTNAAKVEVYYFHFTRRCVTCQAVETETQKIIATLYPTQYKAGKITFKSINLDEKESKVMAEKCKAEGQSLLIISGNKRLDLTDTGFMYAKSNPEKLKTELKKAIDPLLK